MSLDARQELLLRLYDQLWNSINRQIEVVWQSVSVLVGAFAILTLVEKNIVPLDIAVSIILLLSTWLMAHVFDSSLWYNRNLAIIANIERQFLASSDIQNVHHFFRSHRSAKMLDHLKLQMSLGLGLSAIVIFYHFMERVYPGLSAPWSNFQTIRGMPYMVMLVAILYLMGLKKNSESKYSEFLKKSPGAQIERQIAQGDTNSQVNEGS
ncbi:MAG: hypothetical protein AB7T38_11945 [Nitrospirales bacterium]